MRLITPNFHVILIHFPLALLGVGMLIELLHFMWRRSSIVDAGRWMILIGALAMIPASTAGIFALLDVASHGQPDGAWVNTKAASGFTDQDWHHVKDHLLFGSAAAILALAAVITWLGSNDRWRAHLYFPALLTLVIAWALMGMGAWHGGEMVYQQGFGVTGEKTVVQPDGTPPPTTLRQQFNAYTTPQQLMVTATQLHLIAAGWVVSIAALGIGLSLRRSWIIGQVPGTPEGAEASAAAHDPQSLLQALDSPYESGAIAAAALDRPRVPSARFWAVGIVLVLLTIVLGLYLSNGSNPHDWLNAKDSLKQLNTAGQRRMGLHVAFGVSILLLCIVMAIFARFAPHSRVTLAFFAAVLLAAMAAQVWVGVLMLYDSDDGPITGFKTTAELQQAAPTTGPSMNGMPPSSGAGLGATLNNAATREFQRIPPVATQP